MRGYDKDIGQKWATCDVCCTCYWEDDFADICTMEDEGELIDVCVDCVGGVQGKEEKWSG